jgi:sarcosine/dimethylglycine N-methyltransferase
MNESSRTKEALRRKIQKTYDDATSLVWQLAVYEPVHQGLRLSNIGGRQALNRIVDEATQHRLTHITELCCGTGDGCRYLAERLDACISGVDINAAQIQAARTAPEGPALRGRVGLQLCDILEWRPGTPQDLVFSLDSLMLVGELELALQRAQDGLRPGGRLFIYDVLSGPAMDDETRRYAREEDGIVNLPTPGAYLDMLRAIGFEDCTYADATAEGVRCFDAIGTAIRANQARIIDASGWSTFRSWLLLSKRYRDAFAGRKLAYGCIRAIRGPSMPSTSARG